MSKININRVSFATLVIALGIIYGDIGTSPLYVLSAITRDPIPAGKFQELIIGGISCVIWTLTLQTTIKYVILTLKADNNGEGGIFSLYALVRRQKKWLVVPAMIGGAALLADGMITPPITVTSAIEGLRQIPYFHKFLPEGDPAPIMFLTMAIISALFFIQQFGTDYIGKLFGPGMIAWFLMIAIIGGMHLIDNVSIFKAFNPYYAIHLLMDYPNGFWLLGAVFLCTTGAEALYSDLGHTGRKNIYYTWIFVKLCLIINYLGQGAYLLAQKEKGTLDLANNPFYAMMPENFRIFGIFIATGSAVIASQALISGSFTLISEAIRLNLWPKMKIKYPTEEKGQVFIPGINTILWVGCLCIVWHFKSSDKMEAAYGLAITLCMISTSVLFANFMIGKRIKKRYIILYLSVYLLIEGSFLGANLNKFPHGGYVAIIAGGILFAVMYVWYRSRKIKNRYVEFVRLEHYIPMIQELSNDKSISMYSTHLVYMTSANNPKEIEHKIIYSILNRKPKRADIYWFVHVDILDDPYTTEFTVEHIIPNDIIRVEFRLGFRVEQKIQLMMKRVVEELYANKEVNIGSRYDSLEKNNIVGDFRFIVLEKFLSTDNELPFVEKVIMRAYFWLKRISLSEERGFGLDPSYVHIEKFPLIVSPSRPMNLKRIYPREEEDI
ncbi:MAG: KUP/HAK/KT family potassium transporter [Arachidicoccus sp.]|nr:KUP/HAK/KT family potassium transporter [Arachidicoccus sp.]